jgi:hypothetical protein
MTNPGTLPQRSHTAAEPEPSRLERCIQQIQQWEEVLRNESAALRLAADVNGAAEEARKQKMHEIAIHLDALAWEMRSFDPDDPAAGHIELPTPAGMPSVPGQVKATNSGEGTRTDLGDGTENFDTGGDISS